MLQEMLFQVLGPSYETSVDSEEIRYELVFMRHPRRIEVLPIWKLFICLVRVNERGGAKLVQSAHELSRGPVESMRKP